MNEFLENTARRRPPVGPRKAEAQKHLQRIDLETSEMARWWTLQHGWRPGKESLKHSDEDNALFSTQNQIVGGMQLHL